MTFVARRQSPPKLIDTGEPCGRGHIAPRYQFKRSTRCVECCREDNARNLGKKKSGRDYLRAWAAKNRDYVNARRREWRSDNREKTLVNVARASAKRKGIPFDLSEEDIVIPSHCPVLGIELKWPDGPRRNNTPSLDRIVPSKGYVRGNVLVVSWRVNFIKSDATIEELRSISDFFNSLSPSHK